MVEYKTVVMPAPVIRGINKKEFKKGLSQKRVEKVISPVEEVIMENSNEGWHLHSVHNIPQLVSRKKTFAELILGWIPFLGNWIFPNMKKECTVGADCRYFYTFVFAREV